jgi:hypothetical protein
MTQHKRDVIPRDGDIAGRRLPDDAAPYVRVIVNFHHGLRVACLWAAKDEPRSPNKTSAAINKRVTHFMLSHRANCPALASIGAPGSKPIVL